MRHLLFLVTVAVLLVACGNQTQPPKAELTGDGTRILREIRRLQTAVVLSPEAVAFVDRERLESSLARRLSRLGFEVTNFDIAAPEARLSVDAFSHNQLRAVVYSVGLTIHSYAEPHFVAKGLHVPVELWRAGSYGLLDTRESSDLETRAIELVNQLEENLRPLP